MSARVRSTVANNTNGSLLRRTKSALPAGDSAPCAAGADRVARERAEWVLDRQNALGTVLDAHDTLVREAFHLEKFVTLVSYDPKAAKADTSAVFQEFRQRYDLVDHSSSAGPSRQTRRAHTERLQSLKAPFVSAPQSRLKKNTKTVAPFTSPDTALVAANTKGKGKGKPIDGVVNGTGASVSSAGASAKGKGKMKAVEAESGTPSTRSKVQKRTSESAHVPIEQPPAKKRRLVQKSPLSSSFASSAANVSQTVAPASISAVVPRHMSRSKRMPDRHANIASAKLLPSQMKFPLAKQPSVKRIKLIVRPPDPVYTHPGQIPPTAKHDQSLVKLLSSYTVLDDNDVDAATVEQLVQRAAAFWDRVDSLQKQGRFFPHAMGIGENTSGLSHSADASASRQSRDLWSHVVDAMRSRALSRPINGRQVAAQVASRVRAYWESRALKQDKVKAQEEKRLRALAKATIKLVIVEWKKAVFHVREEERLKREEEERRRGHLHLDAILDQSGQILEAQQLDLSKAASRSRSSSVSAMLHHWTPMSPEADGVSLFEADVGSDDELSSEVDGTEDDPGVDSTFLLAEDDIASLMRSRSTTTDQSISRSASVSQSQDDHDAMSIEESVVHSESEDRTDATPMVSASPNATASPNVSLMDMDLEYPDAPDDVVDGLNTPILSLTSRLSDHDIISSPSLHPDDATPARASAQQAYYYRSVDERIVPSSTSATLLDSMDNDLDMKSRGILDDSAAHLDQLESTQEIKEDASLTDSTGLLPDVVRAIGSTDVLPSPVTVPDDERTPDAADANSEDEEVSSIPMYLRLYAVAPVEWDLSSKVKPPFLLRGSLRPYQQAGLEWLASLHTNNLNGILADEMGLGKTIQTISLLAHLACDRGIWGPHLIIVPTSVLLNWEMEFKKFLPGFKVLSYHGNTKRRKELRQGWNNKYHFNVCVTSYTLASRDAHVFKRKPWYYMILDEAHMIKNFKSQRWNILLMFRSFRRLLLTGTPLQNNLTELWALLQFLMSGTNFANLKEFGDWFSNPLEKAIEMGTMDDETQQRVAKLHTVLRPYLLRRLKRDVEKELPQKFEHLVMCPLSKRQRFLYDEFMTRAETRHDLQSGVYQKIANILMQLRKVVNHPDLFEVRPIVTSFAMARSAIADFEIKELLIRRRLFTSDENRLNLDFLGLQFGQHQSTSLIAALETRRLDGTSRLPMITEPPGEPPPHDVRTVEGYRRFRTWQQKAATIAKWAHIGYVNRLRCSRLPLYSEETIAIARSLYEPLRPMDELPATSWSMPTLAQTTVKSYAKRVEDMAEVIDKFAFATPVVVARDMPSIALSGFDETLLPRQSDLQFDAVLHRASVKLQIAFPDPSLLQYDCGKLQELARLLRERKAGGHRILIFTQMTKILDILEIFLNLHGYLYLRLDGATKIEDRQYITERFNSDSRIFCFISSSRSGGVGINLTGADTVIFYDSDFNPQMDRQCEDRAHRIGQIRDVHIYRFISEHTVEEALLRKANQKRSLDNIVIQQGEFDWRSLFSDETALTKALGEFEDSEDAHAAAVAASEEVALVGADEADFSWEGGAESAGNNVTNQMITSTDQPTAQIGDVALHNDAEQHAADEEEEEEEEGGTTVDYMLSVVRSDMDFFSDWRL